MAALWRHIRYLRSIDGFPDVGVGKDDTDVTIAVVPVAVVVGVDSVKVLLACGAVAGSFFVVAGVVAPSRVSVVMTKVVAVVVVVVVFTFSVLVGAVGKRSFVVAVAGSLPLVTCWAVGKVLVVVKSVVVARGVVG